MKAKTVIFCNQKGGVGKTTACRNLGYYLAETGYHVLLIDMDAQGNLSKSFFDEERIGSGIYEALTSDELTIMKITETLQLIAGDKRLSALNKQLVGEIDGYSKLKTLLERTEFQTYDFIFIDLPPSLGMLTNNGMAAADYLFVPLSSKLYSMQGCNTLLEAVGLVRKTFNPELKILGFLINDFDKRLAIECQIREEIEESMGDWMFKTILSSCVKVEEAIALGVGVTALTGSGTTKIKRELKELGVEVLDRLGVGSRQAVHEQG